jgi:hypothetical protein
LDLPIGERSHAVHEVHDLLVAFGGTNRRALRPIAVDRARQLRASLRRARKSRSIARDFKFN